MTDNNALPPAELATCFEVVAKDVRIVQTDPRSDRWAIHQEAWMTSDMPYAWNGTEWVPDGRHAALAERPRFPLAEAWRLVQLLPDVEHPAISRYLR